MALDEKACAQLGACLFVGDCGKDKVTLRGGARAAECEHETEVRRTLRLHINGAAAPYAAVCEFSREGRMRPALGLDRDYVSMRRKHQWRLCTIAASDSRNKARARGGTLDHGGLDSAAAERGGDEVGRDALVAGWIGGIELYQFTEVSERLPLECVPRPSVDVFHGCTGAKCNGCQRSWVVEKGCAGRNGSSIVIAVPHSGKDEQLAGSLVTIEVRRETERVEHAHNQGRMIVGGQR